MSRWVKRSLAMGIFLGALAAVLPALPGAADAQSEALALSQEARELAAQGQFDQAIAKAEDALRLLSEAYGAEHEYVGHVHDHLATLHYGAGRLDKALAYAQRAAQIVGKERGRASKEYALIANNLATILLSLGRYKEAEAHYRQAYQILVKELGKQHERSAFVTRNLGILNRDMSRLEEAREFFEQSLAANQAIYGDQSSQVARAYLDLAGVYITEEATGKARGAAEQAKQIFFAKQTPVSVEDLGAVDLMLARIEIQESALNEAEQRLEKALEQLKDAGLADSLTAASALDLLGNILILRGQAVEAEPIYKRVLALYRKVVGERHPAVARTLHNLAIVYQTLGQYAEAERFYQKAIAVFTASFGPVDGSVAASRLEYGLLLSELNRAQEAIREAKAALEIYQQLPATWAIQRAYASSSLGFALHRAGRLEEAIEAFQKAMALMAEVRGKQSSDLPPGLTQLGEIYMKLGRLEQAEVSLNRAIAIREKDRAATPAGIAKSLAVLAQLRLKQGRPDEALAVARRYIALTEARLDIAQRARSAAALGEQRVSRGLFEQYLEIAQVNQPDASTAEMFRVAQLPHISGTAAAVARMAARFAAQLGTLATLVRERQDALERWQAVDRQLTERLGGTAQGGRREEKLRAELSTLADKIQRLEERSEREFPEYTELTNPRPLGLDLTQGLLKPHEALLLQVSTDTGTFVFLLRPDAARVVHTEMTKAALESAVRSLREGLDLRRIKSLSRPPPFDTEAAHYLYRQLFKPFGQELKDVEHIIVVLDGAMQNLPPSLLLVKPAQRPPRRFSQFRQLDFLGRHYAFSVLPSVSSFKLLRSFASSSGVAEPFLGFGDPKFGGSGNSTRSSAEVLDQIVVSIDPQVLRSAFPPLPESRAELQAMAEALNAREDALYFGDEATEANVKEQDLSRYRYIAFATHGLMAGEFRGLAEPALVLTPPEKTSAADDGLLTASEIATLKLNADWVVLSACNTASPEGRPGAEGLSGLAKAFFYAGSRALLVSHWWVASDASVLLTTGAIQALSQNPKVGRAQALRQAMLRLMNGEGNPMFAHPVFWAPFVVVGEGGGSQ